MIHKKDFYFIRHGQTDFNASNTKLDHDDVSLNVTGIRQAKAIKPIIADLSIKSICHSPLKRAKETKELISSHIQANHHEIPELGECTQQICKDMTSYGKNAFNSPHKHVKVFMTQVLNGMNKALSCEGPVLIVAHGGIHWAICCFMHIDHHDWIIGNCLPVHFFVENKKYWKAKVLKVK